MPGMADILGSAPNGAPQVNFQAANQFAQTLNPAPVQEGPPTTPQELEQRKSGWQDFISKLQNDPAMRQAAILTATQMMRGPGQGETVGGSLGRAIQTGVLAHGFLQGNQTNQAMELEKLKQQQALNQSAVKQNELQTSGLEQQQQFAREAQPLKMRQAEQQIGEGDFQEQNRQLLLDETLLNNKSDRAYKANLGDYRKKLGERAVTGGGPKTAAGVQLFERHKSAIRASNPPEPGEDPLDYEGRIEGMALDYSKKASGGNPQAVQVQALQKLFDTLDPKDPLYEQTKQRLAQIGAGAPKADGAGGAAKEVPDQAAWVKARNAVQIGEKYTGPNGKTYTRTN